MKETFIKYSIVFALACMPFSLWAYDFEVDGIYYLIDGNNATVTYSTASGNSYLQSDITIPAEVVYGGTTYQVAKISKSAFLNCTNLKSIIIPSSVTSVEWGAFSGCSNLTSITMPCIYNNVFGTIFGQDRYDGSVGFYQKYFSSSTTMFFFPASLKTVVLTDCTYIDSNAFYGCESLTSITIPDATTVIGSSAFYKCKGLTTFNIPNNVRTIYEEAFSSCENLTTINIPESVESIGKYAFDGSYIKDIYVNWSTPLALSDKYNQISRAEEITLHIPRGTKALYKNVYPWKNFKEIKQFPEIQDIIVFADPKVEELCVSNWDTNNDDEFSMTEAASVDNIGEVFRPGRNSNITSFDELQYFTGLSEISDDSFSECTNLTSIVLPPNVEKIGDYAFYHCSSLSSINIPEKVTSIGRSGFDGCSSLTSIFIPKNVTSIGEYVFKGCSKLNSVTLSPNITSIQMYSFEGCSSLSRLVVPDGVTNIGISAFSRCESLSSIEIPGSVETMGNNAFRGCTNLQSITIPSKIERIESATFRDCKNLVSVAIPNSVTSIGGEVFYGCESLSSVTIPNGVTNIEQYVFYNCKSLSSLTIPNGVTNVGQYAFSGCESLTSVIVPNGVTQIRTGTFTNCCRLESVVIPNNVTSIDYGVFSGCSNLTSITLPFIGGSKSSVNETETSAFGYIFGSESFPNSMKITRTIRINNNTSQLCDFYIPNSLKIVNVNGGYIPSNAFANCSNLLSINLHSITSIYEYAFLACDGLTSIDVPDGCKSIGRVAFSGCKNLKSITIPQSVIEVGNNVFYNCVNLEHITTPASVIHLDRWFDDSGTPVSLNKVTVTKGTVPSSSFSGVTNPISVELCEGVTSIASSAFQRCTGLSKIIISESVSSIGSSAFSGCTGLTEMEIPTNISSLESNTFDGCTNLSSITIPKNVTIVKQSAFANCDNLDYVKYRGTKDQWNNIMVESDNDPLLNADITYNFETILPNDIFESNGVWYQVISCEKAYLAEVLSGNVKYSGEITIPTSVEYYHKLFKVSGIGDDAFHNCDDLKTINYTGTKTQWRKLTVGENNESLNNVTINYNYNAPDTDLANSDNLVYIDAQSVAKGEDPCFFLKLKNTMDVTGFQFEMELPEGLSIAQETDDKYAVELCTQRTTGIKHNIFEVNKLKNGRYLFVCSSTSNSVFLGNDGDVAVVHLDIENSQPEGDYPVCLHNMAISNSSSEVERITKAEYILSVLDEPEVLYGDVNNDGTVSITDAVGIVNFVIKANTEGLNEKAADANQDGSISITDAVYVVNMVIHAEGNNVKGELKETTPSSLALRPMNVVAGEAFEMPVFLNGTANSITAMQFDLALPEGITLSGIKTDEEHTVAYQEQENGTIRVASLSVDNSTYSGNGDKSVILLLETAPGFQNGVVSIENSELVTPGLRASHPESVSALISGNATGIGSIRSTEDTDIYDLQGRKAQHASHGIYIQNGKKTIIK